MGNKKGGQGTRGISERGRNEGNMLVNCWCESTQVWVSPSMVRNGQTDSCGKRGCSPPEG